MTTERIVIEVSERGSAPTAQSIRSIGTSARSSYDFVSLLKTGLATIGAVGAARELLRAADASTALDNRIRSVTKSQAEFNMIQSETFAIAQRTRTGLEDNVQLYQRLRVATAELGISQQEILGVQELINKSLIVGGATAVEASNALRQLTQGLASGALRGDEFRSVSEQLPFILPLISKELGVSTGELKKMAEQGKITTQVIIGAFRNAREEIEGRFAASIATPSQSLVVLKNSFIQVIGEIDRGIGITRGLAQGIILLADNLLLLTKTLITAGAAYVAFRAAQFVSNRQDAIEATTKAIQDQGVIIVANTEREAQRAVSAVAAARADLAATDAAISRTGAEAGLAAALTSREAAEKFAAIPERAALAETEAAIARIEAERGVALTVTEVAVADKAAAVAAGQLALANTQAALSEERLAAAAAARLAATGRGSLDIGIGTGALASAGTGRIASADSSARIAALMAEETRQAEALAAAQVALAGTQQSVNTGNMAAIATEKQLAALRALREEQTIALAGAEAGLAIEEQALVGSGLAASETEIAALRTTRAAQAQGLAAAETELAIANRGVAAANAGVAGSEPILTRALASIKNGFRSLWTTISLNPILFLITALTAMGVALFLNRDKIRLTGESTATLGDALRVLGDDISTLAGKITRFIDRELNALGIKLEDIVPRGDTFIQKFARFLDLAAYGFTPGALKDKTGAVEQLLIDYANHVEEQTAKLAEAASGYIEERERLLAAVGGSSPSSSAGVAQNKEFSTDEIEKITKAYEQLVASVDPATDALFRQRDAQATLDTAITAGIPMLMGKNEVLALLGKSMSDNEDAYGEAINNYKQEVALLGMSVREQRIMGEVLDVVNTAKSNNKALTEDQIAVLRAYAVVLDDAAEKEKNLSDLQQLRSSIDPREGARNALANVQKTLGESMRLGNTGVFDAVALLQRYRDANADALDPVAALNKQHEERMRVLALSAEAQAVESEAVQRYTGLLAAGIPLREIDIELIRRQVAEERNSEKQGQQLIDVLNRYGDASEQAAKDVELLKIAHALGLIQGEEYARAIEKAQLAVDKLDKSAEAGARRGLVQLKEQFSDVGAQVEGGIVNSFRAAEDALLEFFKTGKFGFKEFADVIISELMRIAIQQTIMKALATVGVAMFGQGGTTTRDASTATYFASGGIVDHPELFSFGGGTKLGVRGEAGAEAIMPLRNGGSSPTVGARTGDRVLDVPLGRLPGGDLGVDLTNFFMNARADSTMHSGRWSGAAEFASGGAFSGGSPMYIPTAASSLSSLPQMRSGGGGAAPVIQVSVVNHVTVQASSQNLTQEQQEQLGAQAVAAMNRAIEAQMFEFVSDQSRDGGAFNNPGHRV